MYPSYVTVKYFKTQQCDTTKLSLINDKEFLKIISWKEKNKIMIKEETTENWKIIIISKNIDKILCVCVTCIFVYKKRINNQTNDYYYYYEDAKESTEQLLSYQLVNGLQIIHDNNIKLFTLIFNAVNQTLTWFICW